MLAAIIRKRSEKCLACSFHQFVVISRDGSLKMHTNTSDAEYRLNTSISNQISLLDLTIYGIIYPVSNITSIEYIKGTGDL
jgi:hypothetical protein